VAADLHGMWTRNEPPPLSRRAGGGIEKRSERR
jgi:hypothetical protein